MNLETINNLANDILVARLEIADLEKQLEEITKSPQVIALIDSIAKLKEDRDLKQTELISIMKSNGLTQWKTNKATYAKATRVSVKPSDSYKKAIEKAMKDGQVIDGWELNTTDYISIRTL